MESARQATPADLDRIVELSAELVAELAAERGGELWSAREARAQPARDELRDALGDPRNLVLVGCLDAAVVGLATAEVEPIRSGGQIARLREIFVEPPARRVGVGAALIEGVVRWAGEQGCRGVDAMVLPGTRAAKNFFEAHGLVARAIVVHRPLRADG